MRDLTLLAKEVSSETDVDQFVLYQVCQSAKSSRLVDQHIMINGSIGKTLTMAQPNDVSGTAALAICESLLLALNDHNILPEAEIVGILKDAAAAHHHTPAGDGHTDLHKAVAALINSILAGGNSVRRR
jgi:hypothetical protein